MTHDEVIANVTELQTQMKTALAGVSNFRKFQVQSARNDGFVKAAIKIWSVIIGTVLIAGGWALKEAGPVVKAILQDYYQHHPGVTERLQHERSDAQHEPVLSQNAGGGEHIHF